MKIREGEVNAWEGRYIAVLEKRDKGKKARKMSKKRYKRLRKRRLHYS